MSGSESRWSGADAPKGGDYDARWAAMAASGQSIHGEADLVSRFQPDTVLDAGCGTGRVAIELANRGIDVVGVDLDQPMLDEARRKAPELEWVLGDLASVSLERFFDLIVMAGNVMIFVTPGNETAVVANMARHLVEGGALVAGFQLTTPYSIERYDADCAAAGLVLERRTATWDGAVFTGGEYAVSVHRRPTS
jgi:SAM-dependent methyltransferase